MARTSSDGQARTSKRASTADRLAKIRTSRPDIFVPELAKAAGVSKRHARRLLAER